MLAKNIHVLVVDDVILMCDFLFGVVNKVAGCRAIKALDGKTAAEYLENETVDLLITDIEMKAPSGLELVQRVRAGMFSHTAHDIPIIIFSGNTYRELIEQSRAFDVNDFLAKPINSEQLIKKIHYHLLNEKNMRSAAHYKELAASFAKADGREPLIDRGLRVSIVRDLPEAKTDDKDHTNAADKESSKKDFLVWPDNATTGYFQLDRRMRNFAFNVSCFHNVFIGNCKPVAIESERKRACDAADYLFHISKNIKNKESRREFWALFAQRLDKLKPLTDELASLNIKHHKQVLTLLKRLAYWWMQSCNRPIIQITEREPEVGDD